MIYLPDQVQPGMVSSAATRVSDRVPFLYMDRMYICHTPPRLSSFSSDSLQGFFCSFSYCVIQFCRCSSHVYDISL